MSIQSKIVIVAFSSQGEFVRRAEMIFSAKYFNLDEDSGSIDGDRILERISAIPFEEWNDVPAQEFASKQNLFEKVVYNPEKQTVLLIGEIGDFLRT